MGKIDSLREEIEKTKIVLAESKENFDKNPGDYSAQLLLMSIENHLGDLLKKLANEESLKSEEQDRSD